MPVTKFSFLYTYSHGGTVKVPAGARVTKNHFEEDGFWVDPSIFPKGSIEHHDADHYGIRVHVSNTEEPQS